MKTSTKRSKGRWNAREKKNAFTALCLITLMLSASAQQWVYEYSATAGSATDSWFGVSVGISPSGEILAVGAPSDAVEGIGNAGSVWTYFRGDYDWGTPVKLHHQADGSDKIGTNLVLTNDRLIAGSFWETTSTGYLYPYSLSGAKWIPQDRLAGDSGDRLGGAIATDGSILVTRSVTEDNGAGKLYIFTLSNGLWVRSATFDVDPLVGCGLSISLNAKIILVGVPYRSVGGGILYSRDGNNVLSNPVEVKSSTISYTYARLGWSTAVLSDTVVVMGSLDYGYISIFTLTDTWRETSKISNSIGLGRAMSYSSPFLLISSEGKASLYSLSGNVLTFFQDLAPGEASVTIGYGAISLCMAGNYAAVADYDPVKDPSTEQIVSVNAQPVHAFRLPTEEEDPVKVTSISASRKYKSEKLGYQVATWNDMVLISAPFCATPMTPAACDGGYIGVYKKSDSGAWVFQKIIRNPFRNRDNRFGYRISVNDYYLIVSAPDSAYETSDTGIVVLYKWDDQEKVFKKDSIIRFRKTDKNFDFGSSLSNIDSITAIGMPEYDVDSAANAGCAHIVKKKSNGKWGQRVTITAPTPSANERLGWSVSLQSPTKVAISNNPDTASDQAVYVFDLASGEWIFSYKLSDADKIGFGWKIMFYDDLLYISVMNNDLTATTAGSISVYEADSEGKYAFSYEFMARSSQQGRMFGYSFSTDGTRFVVGAKPCADDTACGAKGHVFVFTKSNSVWNEEFRYASEVIDGSDGYGQAVAVLGDTVLVSAPSGANSGGPQGKVYFLQK